MTSPADCCGINVWLERGRHAFCVLPLGHDGPHSATREEEMTEEQKQAQFSDVHDAVRSRGPGVAAIWGQRVEDRLRAPLILDVLEWIAEEQRTWAGNKYDPEDEDARTRQLARHASTYGAKTALDVDHGWQIRLTNYISRALTLGLETPGGRQALLKFASTAVALAASAARIDGELPPPGLPSGEGVS